MRRRKKRARRSQLPRQAVVQCTTQTRFEGYSRSARYSTWRLAGFPLTETTEDHGRKKWQIDTAKYQPGLAFALAAEFRPLIADSVVLTLINNGEVAPADFIRRAGGVALTKAGHRAVITAFERRMDTLVNAPQPVERPHPTSPGPYRPQI